MIVSEDEKEIELKDKLENIKSKYILQKIIDNLQRKKLLELFKHNKKTQNRLEISTNDYKRYSEEFSTIEIELIPIQNSKGTFINIPENEKDYFHIYFNESKDEIKTNKLSEDNKISKIKIIINYQVKSFQKLFFSCKCIKSISFKKFYRINISNMSLMFDSCSSLEELNLSNLNTNNVNVI